MLGMGSCASVRTVATRNFAQADAEFGRRLAVGLGLTARLLTERARWLLVGEPQGPTLDGPIG
jgi:hypothetical protein